MEDFIINDEFIKGEAYKNNQELEEIGLVNVAFIFSGGAFSNCKNLKSVFFGVDITRIGNRTFDGCTSLTDLWFAITDENKFIEIAEDAFVNCPQQITFHIFASATRNKYLNEYARRHHIRVVSCI